MADVCGKRNDNEIRQDHDPAFQNGKTDLADVNVEGLRGNIWCDNPVSLKTHHFEPKLTEISCAC